MKRSRETVAADERALAEPTTPTADDDVLIAPLQPTASVLVAALDADHSACDAALEQLRTLRDGASAALVLNAYETHFAREEALLDAHLYQAAAAAKAAEVAGGNGAGVSAFSAEASARASHRNDHKRMLTDLRKAMHACAIADDARVPVALVDRELASLSATCLGLACKRSTVLLVSAHHGAPASPQARFASLNAMRLRTMRRTRSASRTRSARRRCSCCKRCGEGTEEAI